MRVVELINRAIKGAKYEWSNFTAARVTWQQLSWDQDEGAPYTYKEEVRVVWDGVTILEGTIRKCSLEQSGDAWRWSIEACDILQPLEAALCFNPGGTLRGGVSAYTEVSGGSGADHDAACDDTMERRKVNTSESLRSTLSATFFDLSLICVIIV